MKATVYNNEWKGVIRNYNFLKFQWHIIKTKDFKKIPNNECKSIKQWMKEHFLNYVLFKFQWHILLKLWIFKKISNNESNRIKQWMVRSLS